MTPNLFSPLSRAAASLLLAGMLLLPFAVDARPPSGKDIIREVQETYEDLETLSCTFTHRFVWAMAETEETSQGTMLLSGQDRFRYETDNQVIVSDGSTLWRFNRLSQQVIIEDLAQAAPGALPKDFLFEFPKDFKVDQVEEVSDDLYRLDLVPKEDGLGVHDVQVWVDGDRWIANRLSFLDDVGNRTEYALTDVTTGEEIDPARFQFTPPESATVFDLR